VQAPATDKDASVVVHPGTLAFLTNDQKVSSTDTATTSSTGFLIFPIFGSAIAAVAGYSTAPAAPEDCGCCSVCSISRRRPTTHHHWMRLDNLQIDVDQLVVAIIHQTSRKITTRAFRYRSGWYSIRRASRSRAAAPS
jgi:hypothetical protein